MPDHHWLGDGWQDVVNVASSVATVLATALSLVALWLSGRATRRAEQAVARERRIDFQLDQLAELADLVMLSTSVAGRNGRGRTRCLLVPELVPVTRGRFCDPAFEGVFRELGEPTAKDGAIDDYRWGTRTLQVIMRDEVVNAMKTLVATRERQS